MERKRTKGKNSRLEHTKRVIKILTEGDMGKAALLVSQTRAPRVP